MFPPSQSRTSSSRREDEGLDPVTIPHRSYSNSLHAIDEDQEYNHHRHSDDDANNNDDDDDANNAPRDDDDADDEMQDDSPALGKYKGLHLTPGAYAVQGESSPTRRQEMDALPAMVFGNDDDDIVPSSYYEEANVLEEDQGREAESRDDEVQADVLIPHAYIVESSEESSSTTVSAADQLQDKVVKILQTQGILAGAAGSRRSSRRKKKKIRSIAMALLLVLLGVGVTVAVFFLTGVVGGGEDSDGGGGDYDGVNRGEGGVGTPTLNPTVLLSSSPSSTSTTTTTSKPPIQQCWGQLGSDLDGEVKGDYFGESVALSANGLVVAASAFNNDGNGTSSGHVRVYSYTPARRRWDQRGQDIDGEAEGDRFGKSVALSSDGRILAAGANSNDGNGHRSGHV